jgi:hypothetical protein
LKKVQKVETNPRARITDSFDVANWYSGQSSMVGNTRKKTMETYRLELNWKSWNGWMAQLYLLIEPKWVVAALLVPTLVFIEWDQN